MKAKDPDRQMDLRAAVDVEQVTGKLMEILDIRNRESCRALTQDRADAVVDCILQDVRGRMLEDLVIYETRRALVRHGSALADDVFKLKFEDGEFDMVVRTWRGQQL